MLIYQVQITIQTGVEARFMQYMKRTHIPDVIATGLVHSYAVWKDKEVAHTYWFNYFFLNEQDFSTYTNDHAPSLRADPINKFPNQFTATRKLFTPV